MAHLELGQPNATLLGVAAHLAERFGAGVIGVTAAYELAGAGHEVTVVDRQRAADRAGPRAEGP